MDDIANSKAFADYSITSNLLDAFDCNSQSKGYYDFVELVYRVRLKWREKGEIYPVLHTIVDEMCKERNEPLRFFYANIRRACSPLLDADEDFYTSLGGKKPERRTVGCIANYLAQIFEFGAG